MSETVVAPARKVRKRTSKWDKVVEMATSRLAKITALMGAVTAMATALDPTFIYLKSWWPTESCLRVDPLIVPATVKYEEWDNMIFQARGVNNCAQAPGLFVTFTPDQAKSFRLKVPKEQVQRCTGSGVLKDPDCWDPKKPVTDAKGNWLWTPIRPPSLEPLRDPGPVEKVSITWAIRDYDTPVNVLRTATSTIEVRK